MTTRKICRNMFVVLALACFAGLMTGCNMVKGFGQDITNVGDAGERMINGEPVTSSAQRKQQQRTANATAYNR